MNRHVNAISGRLSLRPPQRHSLGILDRITEIVPPKRGADISAALNIIRSEYPTVTDFEREFPSLCFALATGVGKTRLMGAFISYLHLAHGINNFFVMAPNLTIYNKLIADFTPNTPKYVFKGIAEFAQDAPEIITGDNYEAKAGTLFDLTLRCKVNIFNISKINSEVRGGKAPKIKRLSEYIGESYFEYLANLPDLVLIMDESHRYRASAGVRAINELKPVLGLELTATPFVEGPRGAVPFKNVIFDYPLAKAMQDGFVKEPAVATQKNFDPSQHTVAELEQIKLQDGIRLHEDVKVRLETYARETEQKIVKPFVLVIARDTTHAADLLKLIQSADFFEGRYRDKVIQVDSSKTGAEEEEMIGRLLKVEDAGEPTEIVIHVNMLKEGWDVTNLYTIVPLRAANARILIEQSIGRGLRLPYGKRTGVSAVDRLSIVAHDKFQEIVDEANRADSPIRMQTIILEPPASTSVSQPLFPNPAFCPKSAASRWSPVPPLSQNPAPQKWSLYF
jgi:type III restriction enzyme